MYFGQSSIELLKIALNCETQKLDLESFLRIVLITSPSEIRVTLYALVEVALD